LKPHVDTFDRAGAASPLYDIAALPTAVAVGFSVSIFEVGSDWAPAADP